MRTIQQVMDEYAALRAISEDGDRDPCGFAIILADLLIMAMGKPEGMTPEQIFSRIIDHIVPEGESTDG